MIEHSSILVKGAREHNLKNIDVTIPHNAITVITGLSGSGKSSLAFDTIFAEGQRRYIESFSAFARSFMDQLKKPDVDSISGLSPSLAINQATIISSPRSTVGTVTEVYDYLRLLFARVGRPYCPHCDLPISTLSTEALVEEIWQSPDQSKIVILAPVVHGKKGEFRQEIQKWIKLGRVRARINGHWVDLTTTKVLNKTKQWDIDLEIDKFPKQEKFKSRLIEGLNLAFNLTKGTVRVIVNNSENFYSILSGCPRCRFSFPKIEPRFFSFNNPRGACPTCKGLGYIFDETAEQGYDSETDFQEIAERPQVCPDCQGRRLRPDALSVRIDRHNIYDLCSLPMSELHNILNSLALNSRASIVAQKILRQILTQLQYLQTVGVAYLSLNRETRTLSGGEAQRIRLASQVGSGLVGVLYVLDEPSIGLHPHDHSKMLSVIKSLKESGNTVIIVEHDEMTIRSADNIIDLGPGAGIQGGSVMAHGNLDTILANEKSLTGRYLKGAIPVGAQEKRPLSTSVRYLSLKGCKTNNLKDIDLNIPMGRLCCISGVSGSGKSSLIVETLYPVLHNHIHKTQLATGIYRDVSGLDFIDKVMEINQKPIGRTPRSNPATYVGLFPLIRDLFSQHPESRLRGYTPGRFSFNVKGGRCEACQGAGMLKVEMHFLSDVFVQCDQCLGKRYNRETLNILYREKNIHEILAMSVREALEFFRHHKAISNKLETLMQVGLDYITLGQSSTTLSGGEAQRVKLSKELTKRSTGKTLYILDEPTTGLHFADIQKLTELLQYLVTQGNTVLVIEHCLEIIAASDHVIDLGPGGGNAGGFIVAQGSPAEIARNKESLTGKFLSEKIVTAQVPL